jgi:molecular chaperone HtpG
MEDIELEESDPFASPVGAFVLDTLTVGMYTDARDAVREYVQNSLDGIKAAQASGLIGDKSGKIEIRHSPDLDDLVISDNGAGISSLVAARTLLSIGKSSKRIGENAGFRGIGRLAGIAYCDTLIFETSYMGEDVGTRIMFDCAKLRSNFDPHKKDPTKDLEAVLRGSCRIEAFEEAERSHFFRVRMKSLKGDGREFLQFDFLHQYLSQYAPVDYDSQKFIWAGEIRKLIREATFDVPAVGIDLVDDDNARHEVRKPYRGRVRLHGGEIMEIAGIEHFADQSGRSRYWGWYGRSQLLGSITDKDCAGLRIRVENIMVGGPQLTRQFFSVGAGSNDRFNDYFVGEVFLRPGLVVPNARRDGFEDTAAWREVRLELEELAKALSTEVRTTSTARNKSVSKLKTEVERLITETDNQSDQGFTSEEDKQKQIAKIDRQCEKVASALTKDRSGEEVAEINQLKVKLQQKKDEVSKLRSFATKNLQGVLNRKQLIVLKAVYDVLKMELDEKDYAKIKSKIESSLRPKKSG